YRLGKVQVGARAHDHAKQEVIGVWVDTERVEQSINWKRHPARRRPRVHRVMEPGLLHTYFSRREERKLTHHEEHTGREDWDGTDSPRQQPCEMTCPRAHVVCRLAIDRVAAN